MFSRTHRFDFIASAYSSLEFMSASYLGVEIGGTKLQMVAGNAERNISERRRLTVVPAKGAPGIREQIQETLTGLVSGGKAVAIGVGFGGPVDWRNGEVCRSHQIEGWSGFKLRAWLEGISGLAVRGDNDANTAPP